MSKKDVVLELEKIKKALIDYLEYRANLGILDNESLEISELNYSILCKFVEENGIIISGDDSIQRHRAIALYRNSLKLMDGLFDIDKRHIDLNDDEIIRLSSPILNKFRMMGKDLGNGLRLTCSDEDGIFLHFTSKSGKQSGLRLDADENMDCGKTWALELLGIEKE